MPSSWLTSEISIGFGPMRSSCAFRPRVGDGHVFGNLDPLGQALIVRNDEHAAAIDAELADHGGMRALEDFDDLAFGAPVGPGVRDARDGAVAVHGAARAVAADIEIARNARDGVVGNQKSVAVAMDADAPGNEFAAARSGDVVPVGELNQFAAGGQAVEGGFDGRAVVAFDAQFFEKMLEAGFPVRLLRDVGEQRGIRHIHLS